MFMQKVAKTGVADALGNAREGVKGTMRERLANAGLFFKKTLKSGEKISKNPCFIIITII